MAEAAVAEPVPSSSRESKPPVFQSEFDVNRYSVRRLRIYEGSSNKMDIFNNGDVYGLKYAVPFQLRSGSQASEPGSSQLAFSADPRDAKRFLISDDIRTAPADAVVLEQRDNQVFVRVGNQPQQIYDKEGVKYSLSGPDFQRNSLVIPVNAEYSLAVTGFDPDKNQVIVQKVKPPTRYDVPLKGIGLLRTWDSPKYPVRDLLSDKGSRHHNYFDREFPPVLGPAKRSESISYTPITPIHETSRVSMEQQPQTNAKLPTYTDVLTTNPPEQLTPEQPVVAETKPPAERREILRRINILKNTTWGAELAAAVGGIALISLLTWALEKSAKVPNAPPAPIPGIQTGFEPKITPHVIPTTIETKISPQEPEPATVLATNLKDQSTWGIFLHDLGNLDDSAIAKSFPGGIPDNLRSAWDAVREVEAQTGQFIRPDDPILLNAVSATTDFLGKENVEKLYGSFIEDVERNNPGASSYLVDSTSKTDPRYGIHITDHRINTDTLRMHTLEDLINKTAAGKRSA